MKLAHLVEIFGDRRAPDGSMVRPNFERWFGNSKVVDVEGKPLTVYHGTWRAFDGPGFKRDHALTIGIRPSLGFHFGSAAAANHRVAPQVRRLARGVKAAIRDGAAPSIMSVYLALTDPLRLPDVGAWHDPYFVVVALIEAGIDVEDRQRFMDGSLTRSAGLAELQSLIEAAGHDGIVYVNKHEDKGSDSWIAFHPNQIKSSIGNSGLFDCTSDDIADGHGLEADTDIDSPARERMRA